MKPDACVVPGGLTSAWSNVLVPLELTVSNVPNPTEELPTGQLIQFVYYQAIALLLQPTRRFCFGITISNQPATRDDNAAPVADVVVVTRGQSLWCRITNLFEPSSGLPQLGALLVYLSRARPSCLGFIEGISPIASNTIYPVSDLLRVSSRSQDSAGHLGEVDLDFTKPLFVSKNPFSRFTDVTEVKSLKKPSLATDTQPTNNPPLVAKLAWLTNDHFLDGRPVEELVLEQVKTIDSRSRGSVAQMRACYVLGSIAGQDSAFARTPVPIIMEGKGATIRQRPFETVRDVFDYLEDSWRSERVYFVLSSLICP